MKVVQNRIYPNIDIYAVVTELFLKLKYFIFLLHVP